MSKGDDRGNNPPASPTSAHTCRISPYNHRRDYCQSGTLLHQMRWKWWQFRVELLNHGAHQLNIAQTLCRQNRTISECQQRTKHLTRGGVLGVRFNARERPHYQHFNLVSTQFHLRLPTVDVHEGGHAPGGIFTNGWRRSTWHLDSHGHHG